MKALGEQCASTLRTFKLSGAARVSDVGLRCVGLRAACLVELDLSGCVGVSGAGVATFGECAHGLVTLKLANCHNLEAWAFQRLVCGCHLLEEVWVSFFSSRERQRAETRWQRVVRGVSARVVSL